MRESYPIASKEHLEKAVRLLDLGTGITGASPSCSCGYTEECAVWCGNGHETGECTPRYVEVTALGNRDPVYYLIRPRDHFAQMKRDYDHYKELYAKTGNEDAFEKMLDNVYIE